MNLSMVVIASGDGTTVFHSSPSFGFPATQPSRRDKSLLVVLGVLHMYVLISLSVIYKDQSRLCASHHSHPLPELNLTFAPSPPPPPR